MTIRKLSVRLAGQIAAGEVVERQSSVVKELIENSVDAGASSIRCDLESAGRVLIRVRDNGSGIPREELGLALAPHATSKIACEEDLSHITTLGFRGEALASIAAVSKLTLSSRTADESDGFCVSCLGPQMDASVMPCPHGVGTTVEVRELFFNTPARRRFLKSDRTELMRIRDVVTRCAMANASIAFELSSDGRQIIKVRGADDTLSRMRRLAQLAGAEFSSDPVEVSCDDPLLRLNGIALMPVDVTAGGAEKCYLFLNGRPIADRLVLHAVREAFSRFSPNRVLPRCVLYIEIDPSEVDVNVHPRKDEVRFHNSSAVHDLIEQSVFSALCSKRESQDENALFGSHGKEIHAKISETVPSLAQTRDLRAQASEPEDNVAEGAVKESSLQFYRPLSDALYGKTKAAFDDEKKDVVELPDFPDGEGSFVTKASSAGDIPPLSIKAKAFASRIEASSRIESAEIIKDSSGNKTKTANVLGMPVPGVALVLISGRYLLVQIKALEREIVSRRFSKAVERGDVNKHPLTMPFAVKTEPEVIKALKQNPKALSRCGFELAFRKDTAEIRAVPSELSCCDLAGFSKTAFPLIASSEGLGSGKCPKQLADAVGGAAISGADTGLAYAQKVLSGNEALEAVASIMGHGACDLRIQEIAYEMMPEDNK